MNATFVRTAVACALFTAASAASYAAGGTGQNPSAQDRQHGQGSMMMGMGGMMGSCPMMGASAGMDPKTAMRMHAEMMRAMSDIMLKYSDQAGAAPSK
ncbi:hypothetical protein E2P84_43945 [Burkholderia cepacia]|uniref:DUF305 domain-containing protein n=1 Tax=Burkholderia cepacia TaxID=292 RepID=A0AAX2RN50_BURCE|nr:hypothetical protein [Burkholderia cepacia]TES60902.1 hypothetical protein E2P84_43945 [Burkholderia cepacia]TET01606.1 hypothetical protein E3D36_16350 [Burkholderia cepacia]TEU47619.1 hypothetical protein E3D37_16585 [Burkholderia cepacia]TEU53491.1 hypothetical protein E3D38_12170 [Burkholderia cepacia]TEV02097.1 hypothetical protein E3D40_13100 [Burkholderia cepacia]